MLAVDPEGAELDVEISPDARLEAAVQVAGRRNRLVIGHGANITAYAPPGFAPPPGPAILLEGEDNHVEIGQGAHLGLKLTVRGSGNRVYLGPDCRLQSAMNLLGADARLSVGAGTTMVQASLQLHEAGELLIGEDCMISSQVYVSISDIHPIYDRATGQRINPPASVIIGDHVWLGLRCMVMKGARIGNGAVVAAGSLVVGEVPPNAVAGGSPARILRENVEWRRDFSQEAPEPIERQNPVEARPARNWKWPFRA